MDASRPATPSEARLVLHADDLGMNAAVTDGILRGFREGLLTSASLLANAPDAARALGLWKELLADQRVGALPSLARRRALDDPAGSFDLGVHLNLTQGRPLSGGAYPEELLDGSGRFLGVFALWRKLRRHEAKVRPALKTELERQTHFLLDHGLRPTHLNGHQYVEMLPPIADMLPWLMQRFKVPVVRVALERSLFRSAVLGQGAVPRWMLARVKRAFARRLAARMDRQGIAYPDAFFGTAHAGRIGMGALRVFLGQPRLGWIEVGMHPAAEANGSKDAATDGWHDPLAARRPRELELLLSEELAIDLVLRGVRLGRLQKAAA